MESRPRVIRCVLVVRPGSGLGVVSVVKTDRAKCSLCREARPRVRCGLGGKVRPKVRCGFCVEATLCVVSVVQPDLG